MKNKNDRYVNSMVLIASKHGLEPEHLADALVNALDDKISLLGRLEISCRKVNQDSAIFLITEDENVLWQASINLEMMMNPNINNQIKNTPIPEKVRKTNEYGKNLKIDELKFGMKEINITAEIVEIPPARLVNTKWGTPVLVSNAKIADETGSIRLSLWNNQIKTFQVGDEVEIKNCSVNRFAGEPQLRIARKGTLSAIDQPQVVQFPIKTAN